MLLGFMFVLLIVLSLPIELDIVFSVPVALYTVPAWAYRYTAIEKSETVVWSSC